MFFTTITQKGQITLPKQIRDLFGFTSGQKIGISVVDPKSQTLQVKATRKLTDLAGKYKVKRAMDPVKIRAYMEKHYQRV